MGYYLRFISNDELETTLDEIEALLQAIDVQYAFQRSAFEIEQVTDVYYGGVVIGQIEINHDADDIFADDLDAFRDMVGEAETPEERYLVNLLTSARYMVVVEALWQGVDAEKTLTKFDPLWDWLFANRIGVLQADNEGFYDKNGLIVERKFML